MNTIRFADGENGWLFGPQLWTTHDGGEHWTQTTLPGISALGRVAALEAANGRVHVAVLDRATAFEIETSAVGTDAWTRSPTTIPLGAGPVPDVQIVLHGSAGWMVEVDRGVVGGARLTANAWVPWDPPCTNVNGPMVLAAASSGDLTAVCDEGVWGPAGGVVGERLFLSSDGGVTFRQAAAAVPVPCCVYAVADSPGTEAVVATGLTNDSQDVLVASFDGGVTWAPVYSTDNGGSWAEVGFTSSAQGIAVEHGSDAQPGALLMTSDGGHTWRAVPLS